MDFLFPSVTIFPFEKLEPQYSKGFIMIVTFKVLTLCGQESVQQTICEPRAVNPRLTQAKKCFSDSRASAFNYHWTGNLEKMPRKIWLTSGFSTHFVQAAAGANAAGNNAYDEDDHRHYSSSNGNCVILHATGKEKEISIRHKIL